MRVYLKGEPAPMGAPPPQEVLPRSNGNGGSHGSGEASAFRELLTEFRNLTERYGQALLALGEARGEVAGLRSRVELLEARLDLRLPSALDTAPIAWEAPTGSAPAAPEPPAPDRVEPVMPTPAPVLRTPRPRKPRSTRSAVAGFADALARAQDPNVADVGDARASREVATEPAQGDGSQEVETVAEAVVALEVGPTEQVAHAEQVAPVEAAEVAEPAEADAAQPTYSAAVVEPDWFADGDFSWLDAADMEARGATATVAALAPAPAEVEPEPEAEPQVEAEPIAEAPSQPAFLEEPEAAAEPMREPEPEAEPARAAESLEPIEVSGAGAGAFMWPGAAGDAASEMEIAPAARHAETTPAPSVWDPLETAAWPASDVAAPVAEAMAPPLAMTEQELAQLARDEGWDDAEVAAIRAMISRPAPRAVQLPGAAELDEAMAALQAVPIGSDPHAASPRQWTKPATHSPETGGHDDWAFEAEPAPTAARQSPVPQRGPVSDPNWLRRRRGPAASAYRRIRRIFTG